MGARFSVPVQTGPGAHQASCTMGTGFFPGVKSGRGVTLTPLPVIVPWPWKGRAIPLLPLWAVGPVQSLSACTMVTFTFYLGWKENKYRICKKSVALYWIREIDVTHKQVNFCARNLWNMFMKCMLIVLFITDWLNDWWACNCFACPLNMQHQHLQQIHQTKIKTYLSWLINILKPNDFILWNNQQMQLYAVNFIPLLGSLYMFRVFYTPVIRSKIFNCIYSHWYKP